METKKLGFGLMRLPVNGSNECGGIDLDILKKMVDHFLEEGFTYFDTSYVYHNGFSERAVKAALVDRHPRESFTLADKLPTWMITKKSDVEKYLDEQLQKTGAGYFDYYLCHAVTGDNYKSLMKAEAFEEFKRFKEEGKIRHICISFHNNRKMFPSMDGWQNILYGCITGRNGTPDELASKESNPEIKEGLKMVADEF